ncbi:uncharacterized protein LOC116201970 isoform X2 [Punica granatum]|uniref:Uncharacterized protein LOC116201970 isoform X2 n=1 Tax=Punica granatum TaxID=22663 RepID=A0A6P8D724_PUNGR|nr:uncharacterized protein LOC116201970 isoform X2 [Punica granatum]
MPKDRRERSVSSDRCRASPFRCSSSRTKHPSSKVPSETEANIKEWEEARCPVCIEHPHNAVLLILSTPTTPTTPTTPIQEQSLLVNESSSPEIPQEEEPLLGNETLPLQELSPPPNANLSGDISQREHSPPANMSSPTESTVTELHEEHADGHVTTPSENPADPKLLCPLCRGQIKDWIVVDAARRYMNAKSRSCACATCEFSGTYMDLRKHARLEHPTVRPTEADPERQRSWRRLERQRDLGDLLSTLQSSFEEERGEDSLLPMDERGWLTVFFLIRVFRPESSSRNSSWSGTSRARAQLSFRRRSTRLWGESYDGETISFSTEDDNESSGDEVGPWRRLRRTRRRTTPDDQP